MALRDNQDNTMDDTSNLDDTSLEGDLDRRDTGLNSSEEDFDDTDSDTM